MGANGATAENRAEIYARLYQAAGAKWAAVGAASHGICLYAHDEQAQRQFFRYGFGMRTVDAIRGMDEVDAPSIAGSNAPPFGMDEAKALLSGGYDFSELAPDDILEILPLHNMLNNSFADSPFFMYNGQSDEAAFLSDYENYHSIYFVARQNGRAVAFIRAELDGETFIQNTPGYLHCKGLYCLPKHRGTGVSQTLLNLLVQKLKADGYERLGVDFESFNPSGSGFWLKHFAAYTYGVVRRIDEKAIQGRL
jgi:GNAT superfamily N-acetyltransferase